MHHQCLAIIKVFKSSWGRSVLAYGWDTHPQWPWTVVLCALSIPLTLLLFLLEHFLLPCYI